MEAKLMIHLVSIRNALFVLGILFAAGLPADEVDSSAQADNSRWVNQQLEVSAELEQAESALDEVKGRLKTRFVGVGRIQQERIYELATEYRRNERLLADQDLIAGELETELGATRTSLKAKLGAQAQVRDELAALIEQIGSAEDADAVAELQQAFAQKHAQQTSLLGDIESLHERSAMTMAAQEALKQRRAKVEESQAWLAKESSPYLDDIRSQDNLELQVHRLRVRGSMLAALSRQSSAHLAAVRTHKNLAAEQIADATQRIDRRQDELQKVAEAIDREEAASTAQKEQEAERVRARSASKVKKILAALPRLKSGERRKLMRQSVEAQKQVVEERKKLLESETAVRRYEVDIETGNVTDQQVAEELKEARDRLAYQQGQFDETMARSLELAELAGEARVFEEEYYQELLTEAKTNVWRVSVGGSHRVFGAADFSGQNFANFGAQGAGTQFISNNFDRDLTAEQRDVLTAAGAPYVAGDLTNAQIAILLDTATANGPYGVQSLNTPSVDSYYTPPGERGRFEDQEFNAADPDNNVTIAADYIRFDGSDDDLDTALGSSIAFQRRLGENNGWNFALAGRVGHQDLDLGVTHKGNMFSPGSEFTARQYRHSLVDVDENSVSGLGFGEFLVAVNPYDAAFASLGDGTATENNTTFSMRNSLDADILAIDIGLSADYRGDRFAWTFGLGTTLTYIDGETTQAWTASWSEYSSSVPTNGFYPSAPFAADAGSVSGSDTDSSRDLSLGAYVMAGGRYYITPVISIGADLRYDFVGDDFKTDHVELDLNSYSLEIKLSYDF
jgi:hypothetical protein